VYVTPPYSLSHAFAGTSPPPSPALDSGAGLGAGLGVGAIAVLIVAIVIVGVVWWRKRPSERSYPGLSCPVDKYMYSISYGYVHMHIPLVHVVKTGNRKVSRTDCLWCMRFRSYCKLEVGNYPYSVWSLTVET